jgi:hypothetical protein
MAEMTRRERIMAASRKQRTDRLPFFHYWRHSQIGWAERDCRNRGMGINWMRPSFVEKLHGVTVTEQTATYQGQSVIRRTYSTPVGSVYLHEKRFPGTGQWHANRSWKDVTPWVMERLIKGPEDYKVVKYIVEHTEYVADYFPIEQAKDWLGDEGVVIDALPHSPMQMQMIHWVGSEGGRFFLHHADYLDMVEELYRAMCKSREPLYEIAAKSPAEIVSCGDNVDGFLVNPRLFAKYFMPVYLKQAEVLHRHGKLMAVHMDGRVRVLKDLIAKTQIDIVEALHPPPMGDLPISEALQAWPDKSIWVGFPGGIYELGAEAVKKSALELLRDIGTGDRVVMAMSTENIVSNENLLALTSVLENATLPLTRAKLGRIEKSLV